MGRVKEANEEARPGPVGSRNRLINKDYLLEIISEPSLLFLIIFILFYLTHSFFLFFITSS